MSQRFSEHLGMEHLGAADGHSRLRLTVDRRHLRELPIMHGGVLASLLDSACGKAAGSVAGEGRYVVTVQLNINFVRPAAVGDVLEAHGEVVHRGGRTAVTLARVTDAQGRLVGHATGTFMFLTHEDRPRG